MASSIEGLQRKWDPSTTFTFKARKKDSQKNVLTRMTGRLSVGPFSLLLKSIREHLKIRVWTRSFNHVRGICTGYVVAYDKHFNMALCDVDEIYRNPRCLMRPKTASKKRKKKKNRTKKQKEENTEEKSTTDTSELVSSVKQCLRLTEAEDRHSETDDLTVNNDIENTITGQQLRQLCKESNLSTTPEKGKLSIPAESKDTDTVTNLETAQKTEHLEQPMSSKSCDIISGPEPELSDSKPEELTEPEEDLPTDEEALSNLLESLKAELNELPSTEESGELSNVTSCDDSDVEHGVKSNKVILRRKQDDNSFDSDSSVDGNVSDSSKSKSGPFDLRQKLLKKRLGRSSRQEQCSEERAKRSTESGKDSARKSRSKSENEENCSPSLSRDHSHGPHSSKSKTDDRSRQAKDQCDTKYQRRKSKDRSSDRSRPRTRSRDRKDESGRTETYWNKRRDRVRTIRDKSGESRDRSRDRKTISKSSRNSDRYDDESHERTKKRSGSKSPLSKRDTSRSRRYKSRSQDRTRLDEKSPDKTGHLSEQKDDNTKSDVKSKKMPHHQNVQRRRFLGGDGDTLGDEFDTEKEVLCRHVNQLFIRGDNVVMVALVE